MAKINSIRLKWSGGTHRFLIEPPVLGRGRAAELDSVLATLKKPTQARIPAFLHDRAGAVFRRLTSGDFGQEDIIEPVRCGLIGGRAFEGLGRDAEHRMAGEMVLEHVALKPLADSLTLAQTVLFACIYGVDPDVADHGYDPVEIPVSAFALDVGADE